MEKYYSSKFGVIDPTWITNTTTISVPEGEMICGFEGKHYQQPYTAIDSTGVIKSNALAFLTSVKTKKIADLGSTEYIKKTINIYNRDIRDAWNIPSIDFSYEFAPSEIPTGFIVNYARLSNSTNLFSTTGIGFVVTNTLTTSKRVIGFGDLEEKSTSDTFDTQTSQSTISKLVINTVIDTKAKVPATEISYALAGITPVEEDDDEQDDPDPNITSQKSDTGWLFWVILVVSLVLFAIIIYALIKKYGAGRTIPISPSIGNTGQLPH